MATSRTTCANRRPVIALVVVGGLLTTTPSAGRGGGLRTHSVGPDLITADIQQLKRHGRVGDITAYSIGTTVCNAGDQEAAWVLNTSEHAIIVEHMYRLRGGRLEQIGMSWAAHTFFALNTGFCYPDCAYGGGPALGPHCADAHSANVNGLQNNMEPRMWINAATAVFPYPWGAPIPPATIGRRLQVHDADLHPPDNPGAIYFVEAHYLTADEALAGNDENNVAYRRVEVVWDPGEPTVYDLAFVVGQETQREKPALAAWQDVDPGVTLTFVDVPSDGRLMLGYRVTDLGGGTYHYEYALYNMNSHRGARSFSIPVPAGVTVSNVGFHDVDYHSGDVQQPTDWTNTVGGGSVRWDVVNPGSADANALRWGTTYNYRFDADAPPNIADATVELFLAGTPAAVSFPALGPVPLTGVDCNSNGVDDALDIFAGTSPDCDRSGIPDECDIAAGTSPDCDTNGIPDACDPDCNTSGAPDACDVAAGTSPDCNANGVPDECEAECNGNGIPDACDIAAGTSLDCNANGVPDECEPECNANGIPDACDIAAGTSPDCNTNGTPDECESECNGNGVPDVCDIAVGTSLDCDANGLPDECSLAGGTSEDCNTNGVLDECEIAGGTSVDCNGNAVPDACDLARGVAVDCNTNAIPDTCDVAAATSADCNLNGAPDECEPGGDCNGNSVPDFCDLFAGTSMDCNTNAVLDECDLLAGGSLDCNANGTPDECEPDCNLTGFPDDCDILGGTSLDANGDGVPDECEAVIPTTSTWGAVMTAILLLIAGSVVVRRGRADATNSL